LIFQYSGAHHFSRIAESLQTDDRGHYLAYASRVMRSVIIDFVRARVAERRGGRAVHVRLTTEIGDAVGDDDAQLLRVHEALD
jgi:hypothetical protein